MLGKKTLTSTYTINITIALLTFPRLLRGISNDIAPDKNKLMVPPPLSTDRHIPKVVVQSPGGWYATRRFTKFHLGKNCGSKS